MIREFLPFAGILAAIAFVIIALSFRRNGCAQSTPLWWFFPLVLCIEVAASIPVAFGVLLALIMGGAGVIALLIPYPLFLAIAFFSRDHVKNKRFVTALILVCLPVLFLVVAYMLIETCSLWGGC